MSGPRTAPRAADPAVRATGLGGSDIPVLMGASPFKTAFALYLEKRGELPPEDLSQNEAVQWGIRLEDEIALAYQEKTGRKVRRNNRTLRHKKFPWAMAHIDRDLAGFDGGLECKNTSEYQAGSWGDEGTDEVPPHYLSQCLWYLLVTGKKWWDLAVLIGGNKHRVYTIKAADHKEEMAAMLEAAQAFWQRVLDGNPPPFSSSNDVELAHPIDDGTTVFAADDIAKKADQLAQVRWQVKTLQDVQKDLELGLKEAMGPALILEGDNGKIATWKLTTTRRLDTTRLKKENPQLAAQYTVETSGRRFDFKAKFKEDGDD